MWNDGPFALFNIDQIKIKIEQTTFTSIFAADSTNFGGVIFGQSLGSLTLNAVTSSYVLTMQSSATNGGGSFFYTNYDGLFTLTITGSTLSSLNFQYNNGERGTVNN